MYPPSDGTDLRCRGAQAMFRCLAEMTDPTRNDSFVGAMATRSDLGPDTAADRTSYRNRLRTGFLIWVSFFAMVGMSGESRRRTRDSASASAREGFSVARDSYNSASHATVSAVGCCLMTFTREEAEITGSGRERASRICCSMAGVGWGNMAEPDAVEYD